MTQVSLGRWLTPAKTTDVVVFAGDSQQDPEDVCKDMVRYIVEEAMSRTFEPWRCPKVAAQDVRQPGFHVCWAEVQPQPIALLIKRKRGPISKIGPLFLYLFYKKNQGKTFFRY